MNWELEVEGIVLAMWGEPEEEIAREVMSRFDISYDQAIELVIFAVKEEISHDVEEWQEWHDFDPDC